MRKFAKRFMIVIAGMLFTWLILTLWAEAEGLSRSVQIGNESSGKSALIVYDPDPFYNLDQQVCESFAQGLVENGWKASVVTIASAKEINRADFQLYVFCANTYNWSPDWAVTRFIKKHITLTDKNVIAITLGAGSTKTSQKSFENIIRRSGAKLIDSKSLWLWKPNDQARTKESNVKVAVDMARQWGHEIAVRLN